MTAAEKNDPLADSPEKDRALKLAQAIVDDLFDIERDDIYDTTHGNYSAETFKHRIGAEWRGRIAQHLLSALSLSPAQPKQELKQKCPVLRDRHCDCWVSGGACCVCGCPPPPSSASPDETPEIKSEKKI